MRILVVAGDLGIRQALARTLRALPGAPAVSSAPSAGIALRKLEVDPYDLAVIDESADDLSPAALVDAVARIRPGTLVACCARAGRGAPDPSRGKEAPPAVLLIERPDLARPDHAARLADELNALLRVVAVRLNTRGIATPAPAPVQIAPPAPESPPACPPPAPPPASPEGIAPVPRAFAAVLIAVSTGGPEALARLLPALPATLSVPVLVVQHMPRDFTASLAESLARSSALPLREARADEPVAPGRIYLAPGGRHLLVRRRGAKVYTRLTDDPPVHSVRPAADPLFRSAAEAWQGLGILAVVLTGMGCDGLAGVADLKRAGSLCITQSADSCVVYGMSRSVEEAGLSDLSLPLERIAAEIVRRVEGAR